MMEETAYLDQEQTSAELLNQNPWVYRGICLIASAFAGVPLLLQRKVRGEWVDQPKHKLQKVLHQCDPDRSQFQLMERWAMDIHLTGNAYWAKDGAGFLPVSECGKDGVHWQFNNPDNAHSGLSPLVALVGTLEDEKLAKKESQKAVCGSGKVLILEEETVEDAQKAIDVIKNNWDVEKHGPPPVILTGGQFTNTPQNIDLIENRRFSREEIAAALGIPVLLLRVEGASREALDSAESHMWKTKIIPLLHMFCSTLEAHLFKEHGLSAGDWRITPDLGDVEALGYKKKAAEMEKVQSESVRARSEAYERLIGCGMSPQKAEKVAGMQKTGGSWALYAIMLAILTIGLVLIAVETGVL